MLNRITRTITCSMVALSMLAGCASTNMPPPASTSTQPWQITPSASQAQGVGQPALPPNMTVIPDQAQTQDRKEVSLPDQSRHGQSGATSDSLASQAHGMAQNVAQDWLSQFGTARLSVGQIGQGGDISGALDMLFPIHEDGKNLAFTQLGVRHSTQYTGSFRTTINAGLGYRRFFDAQSPYMLGMNAFYDQDLTVGHQRLGLGAEYWMDNFKVAANGYFPISDWKKSPDLARYFERPATGFDIRAEGYLPMYPHLGGKLMYEQYFGDEVGLFGAQNRQSDPKAWTVGLTYSPVPAVTLGVDHKMGEAGMRSTNATLNFKFQIGVPLAKQFDPTRVAPSRKLDNMRHDLVDRNNEIVLEYQKDETEIAGPIQITYHVASLILPPMGPDSAFDAEAVVVDSEGNPAPAMAQVTWRVRELDKFGTPVSPWAFIATLPTDGAGLSSLPVPAPGCVNKTFEFWASVDGGSDQGQHGTVTWTCS